MIVYRTTRRPGAIAPMTALLLVFMIGMVAFAVDMSWVVLVNSELQNAADASALAASNKLMDNYVLYNLPKQSDSQKAALLNEAMVNARSVAKSVASKNAAGGVTSLVVLDGDIVFGFIDDKNQFTAYPEHAGYPNTVRVQVRRDDTANTPLKLFFAPALQSASSRTFSQANTLVATVPTLTNSRLNLNRAAAASVNGGFVSSFNSAAQSLYVLPMTLDETIWDSYLTKGVDPDGRAGRVDAAGNPTFEIYSLYKDKGNFGQLSLDGSHTGANTTSNWIRSGMEAADVQALQAKKLLPVSPDNSSWNWIGNPGFKASTVMDVDNLTGRVYLLPLFKAKDGSKSNYKAGVGQGSNYYYNIVRFVGVRIMPTSDPNREIVIQPAAAASANFVFQSGSLAPPATTTASGVVTTFSVPRITR